MEIQRIKISEDKLNALKAAISKLNDVTFNKGHENEGEVNAIKKNYSIYIARIKALQDARSAIFDEYEKASDTSNIYTTDTQFYPATVLELQLDQEAEALLKEASKVESKLLNLLF